MTDAQKIDAFNAAVAQEVATLEAMPYRQFALKAFRDLQTYIDDATRVRLFDAMQEDQKP